MIAAKLIARLSLCQVMRILAMAVFAIGSLPIEARAARHERFATAAAEAAQHFGTPAGHAYAMTFVRDVLKGVYDASQGCTQFAPDAMHDVVFIVSSEGRIERTISGATSPYGRCITSSLRLPQKISPPPGKHWAVQLRFINGPRKTEGPDPPFIILSLPGK
jgi:hypothetical protein